MSISDQQLLDTMSDIGGLLFRRLKNELSVHEQIVLDNWLNQQDPANKEFFEDCSDWERVHEALQAMYDIDEEAAFADIQKKIQLETAPIAPVIEMSEPRRYRRMYWMVAAAVLLAVGTTVVLNLDRKKATPAELPVAERFHNDVLPGGDKAVLELADGKKIVLDNASNGELSRQGGTRVIKLDDGQLTYNPGKSNSETTNTLSALSYNTISTPVGGQYQVVLPDGTKVWLNAASKIRFPTSFGGERKVELIGEAFFQVTKNVSAPFKVSIVQANPKMSPLEIEVLGTEFDVMAYQDENNAKATLISGAIKVKAGNEEKTLAPNYQFRLDEKSSAVSLASPTTIEETIAWKNGLFQFQDASIQSIMRQASRWYGIDVSYTGDIHQQFIGKVPRQVNLSTLLKILESTGWVHFQIDGIKITVTP